MRHENASGHEARIVRAAIHPSIGVARIGDADEYLLAPEVPEPLPLEPSAYHDAEGRLKRQAARFRVYGLDAQGRAVKELTPDDAEIRWTVHLANKKSAWYQFQLALDIPEAVSAPDSLLRNVAVADRTKLVIDPGPRSIGGRDASAEAFDTGEFMGKRVYLGELRTDKAGRLVVLGGRGVSASYDGSKAITFANNEGWHDDVADGPVTATVTYEGVELEVDPSWVVVAPPNYAPMRKSVRTMWDLMRDLAIQKLGLAKPERPSFNDDIRPIFERLTGLQWVNAGFAAAFGWRGPNDYSTPEWMARLSQDDPAEKETRKTLANQFRVLTRDGTAAQTWPWVYGDAMDIPPPGSPRQNASLTDTQLEMLQQWAAGDFAADYDPDREPPRALDDVPVHERPALLDKASLDFCLADAFHPGCEMTWPMRTAKMYMAPFRLRHAAPGWIEPGYGAEMTTSVANQTYGPLAAQVPGGITRWMALPWQCDTASCRSGYEKSYDPYVPTFWPARVPNQVLTEAHYRTVMDEAVPMADRLAAFAKRAAWIRPLGSSKDYLAQINRMVEIFGEMGVVVPKPGPGDGAFPETIEVEVRPRRSRQALLAEAAEPEPEMDDADLSGIEKVNRFPFGLLR